MARQVAWAAADSLMVVAVWLSAPVRSRLRLREVQSVDVLRRWLINRDAEAQRYRVGERDLEALLEHESVVRTGVSATSA